MLIQSLKTHFPARAMEWLMSGVLFSWGYYVVTHPQIFTAPETKDLFSGVSQVAEFFGQGAVSIGVMALLTGAFRAAALFVNGAVTKTPLIRLITAFASAFLWTSITVGLWLSGVDAPGVIIYPWFVFADVVSGYRAGYDLVIAESVAKKARSQHVTGKRGRRSSNSLPAF